MQKKNAGNKDEKLLVYLDGDNHHRILPYDKGNRAYFKKFDDQKIIRVNGMRAIMSKTCADEQEFEVPMRVVCKKQDIKNALEFLYERFLPYRMALKNEYHKRYFAELDKIQVGIDTLENGAYESQSVNESSLVEHEILCITLWKDKLTEEKLTEDFPEFIKLRKEFFLKKDYDKPTVKIVDENDFNYPLDYTDIVFIRDKNNECFSCYCTDETLKECKKLLLNEILEYFKRKHSKEIDKLKEQKKEQNEKIAELEKEHEKTMKILKKKLAKMKV